MTDTDAGFYHAIGKTLKKADELEQKRKKRAELSPVKTEVNFYVNGDKDVIAELNCIPRHDGYYLSRLVVREEEYRHIGLATELMTACIAALGDQFNLYLSVEPFRNEPVEFNKLQEFYARFGFFIPYSGTPWVMMRNKTLIHYADAMIGKDD